MGTPTTITAAVCGLVLSLAAAGCGDEKANNATNDESSEQADSHSWTPGPDLDSGVTGAVADGPTYESIDSLVNYGKTAVIGTFEPKSDETSSKNLMKWDEEVSGMNLTVWTVHVNETLAGQVPVESIDVILAGTPHDIGAEPGDRGVLFIDRIQTPSGTKWNVAGVNQGLIALDNQDQLTASVDATTSLKHQIESLGNLDALRQEIEQNA